MRRFCTGFTLLLCLLLSQLVFAQPASLTATIGTPANGDAHYIKLTWASVSGASSYQLEVSPDASTWSSVFSGNALTYNHNSGTTGNTPYYYRVRSVVGGVSSGWVSATQYPFYSACDFPQLPVLSNPGYYGMSLSLAADGNPATTTYSIYCLSTAQYVQADGTLGTSEIFKTMSAWGVVDIRGLEHSTDYCFYAKAKNSDGDIRKGSEAFMAEETFVNDANFNPSSGAVVTKFWSPAACQGGGLEHKTTAGCTGGYIGYKKSFNNKFNCWLRTPQVDCTGGTAAVLKFDLSNAFFVDHPNDRMRFYVWDNSYTSGLHYYYATSVKINGVEQGVTDADGIWLYFDEPRECITVEVTFDFGALELPNIDKLLFYMHPVCDYHDMRMYNVKLDNISVQRSISSSCQSTSFCSEASIETQPQTKNGCINGNSEFSVGAVGNVSSYKWQISTNSGSTWTDLTSNYLYSDVNTPTLSITGITSGMNNYYYRCILEGACSAMLTSDNAILHTIQNTPSAAGSITGGTSVCQGETGVAYSIPLVSGADFYSWSLPADASISSGEGTNSILVDFGSNSIDGDVIVLPASVCGQGAPSPEFKVTVNPMPATPGEISGAIAICGNKNETYFVEPVAGTSYYTWLLPGGWAGSSSQATINAVTNGSGGNIIVTAHSICGSSAPRTLTVVGGVGPGIPNSMTDVSEACSGSSISISVPPVGGADSYNWILPEGWTGTSSTNSITATPGEDGGTIFVSAQNDCGVSAPQSQTVAVKAASIVWFDFSLKTICTDSEPRSLTGGFPAGGTFSGEGVHYEVLFPDEVSPGIHLITYTYTNENGCSATDTALMRVDICSAIETTDQNIFEVAPNPFKDDLLVKFTNRNEGKTVILYDALGKEISSTQVLPLIGELKLEMPASVPAGVLFLRVVSENGHASEIKKVVKTL